MIKQIIEKLEGTMPHQKLLKIIKLNFNVKLPSKVKWGKTTTKKNGQETYLTGVTDYGDIDVGIIPYLEILGGGIEIHIQHKMDKGVELYTRAVIQGKKVQDLANAMNQIIGSFKASKTRVDEFSAILNGRK